VRQAVSSTISHKSIDPSILTTPTDVAREIIDTLIETGKHELILLSRKYPSTQASLQNAVWMNTDYTNDDDSLTDLLKGVHTVLSFITSATDLDNRAQKALIDACVAAGVRRFAPSEWGGLVLLISPRCPPVLPYAYDFSLTGPNSIICLGTPVNKRSGSIYDSSTVIGRQVLDHHGGLQVGNQTNKRREK
jgi:hypothetical protein